MNTSQSETLTVGPLNLSKNGGASCGMGERLGAVGPSGAYCYPYRLEYGERRAESLTKMPSPATTLAVQPAIIVYAGRRSIDVTRFAHTIRNPPCKM
ncbi:hypothetical protein AXW38_03860 [Yersinia ruckeri]|uniref:hypothetical protein n=1 Tax=Yersinia ruckeri TaxID=29486 RepID=UPI0004E2D86C|nr:hypothetical protein [Yersinia ruckeri]ARZ00117.1 hypothetical protein QMA0440_00758 [Yersinia ruckeri]KFE38574.1 putative insecticidal toxin complex protein [Yersinia ruckeri]MCK8563968.1 hypothetical protein [Yersinia ruckeri]MCW6625317.1 hypothetical protein [Yersinia ruckeri]OIX37941.1 hypothetical protein AXW20_03855 [Yersinia ruckeri]